MDYHAGDDSGKCGVLGPGPARVENGFSKGGASMTQGLTRREFVKGTLIGAGALAGLGGTSPLLLEAVNLIKRGGERSCSGPGRKNYRSRLRPR